MAKVDIVCLANSRKLQGRCLAGMKLATGEWIRPVTRLENRELHLRHFRLPRPWGEPQVYDTVRVGIAQPCPECHHPEDHFIDFTDWILLHRPSTRADLLQLRERLVPFLYQEDSLFGTRDDRIAYEYVAQHPTTASLALIRPGEFHWRIIVHEEKRRNRVCFSYRGVFYNIGVTDPVWEQRLATLPPGKHTLEATGVAAGSEVWLTVSLGEPFQGECFKLAAGILVWPL